MSISSWRRRFSIACSPFPDGGPSRNRGRYGLRQIERLIGRVAGQLDVAVPRDRLVSDRRCDAHLALPIGHAGRWTRVELLVRHYRRDGEGHFGLGNGYVPAGRIGRS